MQKRDKKRGGGQGDLMGGREQARLAQHGPQVDVRIRVGAVTKKAVRFCVSTGMGKKMEGGDRRQTLADRPGAHLLTEHDEDMVADVANLGLEEERGGRERREGEGDV